LKRLKLLRKNGKAAPGPVKVPWLALSRARQRPALEQRQNPFRLPEFPASITSGLAQDQKMAMDDGSTWAGGLWGGAGLAGINAYGIGQMFSEGLAFPGYAFLAEQAQRPEYRRFAETIATEMTRKWIRFTAVGDDDKTEQIKQLEDAIDKFKLRDRFCKVSELDSLFGRAHLYIDTFNPATRRSNTDHPDELKMSIGSGRDAISKTKVGRGMLRGFKTIEPVWCYPLNYDSSNPLRDSWYEPDVWFVMNQPIQATRCLKFVGREVPDLLKPAYAFGGLSLTQMTTPYVNNWLRTRQSVADLIRAFTVFHLATDLGESLMDGGEQLFHRVDFFNNVRDNRGMLVTNKDSEDFNNISAPLGSLDALQAQCLSGDMLVKTKRGKIPIRDVTVADEVMTRQGWAPLAWAGVSGYVPELVELTASNGSILRATSWHPIYNPQTNEFVLAGAVRIGDFLLEDQIKPINMASQLRGVGIGGGLQRQVTIATSRLADYCTELFTKHILAPSHMAMTFITGTKTEFAISCGISNLRTVGNTIQFTILGNGERKGKWSCILRSVLNVGRSSKLFIRLCSIVARRVISRGFIRTVRRTEGKAAFTLQRVWNAAISLMPVQRIRDYIAVQNAPIKPMTAIVSINTVKHVGPVYNLEVASGYLPEFFANDILVHNSQEHMAAVAAIPIVKLLGIQPSGLNASSEGEIRTFYDWIHAFQWKFFGNNLTRCIDFVQLHLWGEVDQEIVFDFEPLWALDEKAQVEVRKTEADTDIAYIDSGVLSPLEVRTRVAASPDSAYSGIDVEDVPDLKEEEQEGLMPEGMKGKGGVGTGESNGKSGHSGFGDGDDEEGIDTGGEFKGTNEELAEAALKEQARRAGRVGTARRGFQPGVSRANIVGQEGHRTVGHVGPEDSKTDRASEGIAKSQRNRLTASAALVRQQRRAANGEEQEIDGDETAETFEESKHPRAESGKFGHGGGGSSISNSEDLLKSKGFEFDYDVGSSKFYRDKEGNRARLDPGDSWFAYVKGKGDKAGKGTSGLNDFLSGQEGQGQAQQQEVLSSSQSPPTPKQFKSVQVLSSMGGHWKSVLRSLKSQIVKPSKQQKIRLLQYTEGSWYESWNEHLRAGVELTDEQQELQEFLKSNRLASDCKVFRYVAGAFASDLRSKSVGDVFQDRGFLSTTISPDFNWPGNMRMEITARKGMYGAAIEDYSNHRDENEVLFPAGTKLRILEVSKEHMRLEIVQELGDSVAADVDDEDWQDDTSDGEHLWDIAGEDEFVESEHPRDKSGKFAKYNIGSNLKKALEGQGFLKTQKSSSGKYKFADGKGNIIVVEPPERGGMQTSKWTLYLKDGAKVRGETGKKLTAYFGKMLEQAKIKETIQEAGIKETIQKAIQEAIQKAVNSLAETKAETPAVLKSPALTPPEAGHILHKSGFAPSTAKVNSSGGSVWESGNKIVVWNTDGSWLSVSPGHLSKEGKGAEDLENLLTNGKTGPSVKNNVTADYHTWPAGSGVPSSAKAGLTSSEKMLDLASKVSQPNDTQKNAIMSYTGSDYVDINSHLRAGGAMSERMKEMQGYLTSTEIPEDVTLYRKVSGTYAKFLKSVLFEGGSFQDKAFSSTSIATAVWAGDLRLTISCKKGQKGAPVGHISLHKHEHEFLLPAGARFLVKKIEGQDMHLEYLGHG